MSLTDTLARLRQIQEDPGERQRFNDRWRRLTTTAHLEERGEVTVAVLDHGGKCADCDDAPECAVVETSTIEPPPKH